MTAPAPAPLPAPTGQDTTEQPPPPDAATAETVAVIAGLLAAAGTATATYGAVESARAGIAVALLGLGLTRTQANRLIEMDAARPAPPVVPLSPTTRDVFGDGPSYRARYLVGAASRLLKATAVSAANVVELPVPGTPLGKALGKEKHYFTQHQNAQTQRQQAAQRIDAAANAYGPLLGWYSVLDERTTPECVAANGRNFSPEAPPKIGLPGLKHAGNCRCRPGPPHAGAALVDSAATREDYVIAASREARMAVELAAKGKSGTMANGQRVMGDGLTYDPKTKSFHPTTSAESGSFNSKHPRAAKGGPTGGQFVKAQKQQAAAQKKQAAATASAQRKQQAAQKHQGVLAAAAQRHAAVVARQQAAAKAAAAKKAAKTSTAKTGTGSTSSPSMTTPVPGGPSAAQLAAALKVLAAQKAALAAHTPTPPKTPTPTPPKTPTPTPAPTPAKVKASKGVVHNPKIPAAVLAKAKAVIAARAAGAGPTGLSVGLSADTARYSTEHSPLGDPNGPGLWKHKGWELPAYIQNVAKGIMEGGNVDRSRAIAVAVGKVRDWSQGQGNVSPEVRAASVKAIAEWDAMRARTHAVGLSSARTAIELSLWREALHPRGFGGKFSDEGGGSTVARGGLGGVPKGALRTYDSQTQTRVPAGGTGALKAAGARASTPQTVGGGGMVARGGLGGRRTSNVISGNTYTNEQLTKAALEHAAYSGAKTSDKVDHLARMLGLNLSPEDTAKAIKVHDKAMSHGGSPVAGDELLNHLKKLAKKRGATPYSAASASGTRAKGPGTQTRIPATTPRQLSAADRAAIELAMWTEALHPRGFGGKFSFNRGGAKTGGGFVPVREPRKVTGYDAVNRTAKPIGTLPHDKRVHLAPVPRSGYSMPDQGSEHFAASLSVYADKNGNKLVTGSAISVRRAKGRVTVVRVAAAMAIAASGSGFTGDGVLHEEGYGFAPDPGPTAAEVSEALGRTKQGLILGELPATFGSAQFSRRRGGIELAAAETDGAPLFRLTKDWTAMTPAERVAFIGRVTAKVYA